MPRSNHSETHPLAALGVTPTEIEKLTGGRVKRPHVSLVLHRHRDRLGWDSLQVLKEVFPKFDVQTAMDWKWSDHGGLVPLGRRPKRKPKRAS